MKIQTGILSLSLVAISVYAGYLHFENLALRDQLEEQGVQEIAATASEETEETVLESTPQKEVAATLAVSETQPAAESPRNEARERGRARMTRMAAAFDDPEMRLDMIERQMGRIDERFAGFFKTLDISVDEMDTLRTLMAERNVLGWEARMRRRSLGGGEEAREEANLVRNAQREVLSAQVQELLGENKAVELEDYRESLPYREEVEALASSLSFTETPLNAAQNELLVQSLQSVSSDFEYTNDFSNMRRFGQQEISTEDVAVYFEERAEFDELVISAAEKALSEEQLTVFAERQIADRERDQRRMEFMQEGRQEN